MKRGTEIVANATNALIQERSHTAGRFGIAGGHNIDIGCTHK